MEYESDILKRLINTYGVVGNPRYISEIIKEFIVQGKERFPELFTYQADWLAHIDEFGLNPSYTVSYTGQSIYAPNTLERPVKSAILKGQTMVNLINATFPLTTKTPTDFNGNFEYGKTYTIFFDIESIGTGDNIVGFVNNGGSGGWAGRGTIEKNGKFSLTLTIDTKTTNGYTFRIRSNNTVLNSLMILEGDYTNVDIPYFEGMQSVRMPVLRTVGKNLFDSTMSYGFISDSNGTINTNAKDWLCSDYVKLNKGTYTISSTEPFNGTKKIAIYDNNTTFVKTTTSTTFVLDNDGYVRVGVKLTGSGNILEEQISLAKLQIEVGTQATSFEQHKTNILTVNEDVTLRSNGSVCDELDLLTGKLTQRIDEDGEILTQEVVKTVDLTILDQNGQIVKQLMSFNGGTHFNTGSLVGSPLPLVSVSVETDLEETLKVCSLEGNTM